MKTEFFQKNVKALALPRVHQIAQNIFMGCFPWIMKLTVALRITEDGLRSGRVKPNETILVDSSSGTLALGLAIAARLYEVPVVVYSDSAIDESLLNLLELLGARVEFVQGSAGAGNSQSQRLAGVSEFVRAHDGCAFWTRQYDNPSNALSYEDEVTNAIVEQLPSIDYLVCATGSGGSLTGLATALRKRNPHIIAVAVDTHNSILFGHVDKPRTLRGLGNSIMPKCLNHRVVDLVYWISAADAFYYTRSLCTQVGLYRGATTGAVFGVAKHIAEQYPGKTILALSADSGERYSKTAYSDAWCKENQVFTDFPAQYATEVQSPHESQEHGRFSFFRWNRRTLQEVVGNDVQYPTTDQITNRTM